MLFARSPWSRPLGLQLVRHYCSLVDFQDEVSRHFGPADFVDPVAARLATTIPFYRNGLDGEVDCHDRLVVLLLESMTLHLYASSRSFTDLTPLVTITALSDTSSMLVYFMLASESRQGSGPAINENVNNKVYTSCTNLRVMMFG
jgi:hypothetical protein